MTEKLVLGVIAVAFGAPHVFASQRAYDFYQRHAVFRLFSGSTVGAMRMHGAILMALGVVLITVGLAA